MKIKSVFEAFISIILVLFIADLKAEDLKRYKLKQAENLIHAFYSFDRQKLNKTLSTAQSSKPLILFYQGWANGGNYKIVKRIPCVQTNTPDKNENVSISCSITVKDDLMKALGVPFDVTDTFHLTFQKDTLTNVTTSSNDLQVYRDAEDWVWSKRNVLVKDVCKGFFKGGLTPGECVKAMAKGYAEFARSEDFPKEVIFEQD